MFFLHVMEHVPYPYECVLNIFVNAIMICYFTSPKYLNFATVPRDLSATLAHTRCACSFDICGRRAPCDRRMLREYTSLRCFHVGKVQRLRSAAPNTTHTNVNRKFPQRQCVVYIVGKARYTVLRMRLTKEGSKGS
jgi:hypothetical protein